MNKPAGSKYCYLYTQTGVLMDAGNARSMAERFGVGLHTITEKVNNGSMIQGYFLSYRQTFQGFLDSMQDRYGLSHENLMKFFGGMEITDNITKSSFMARTAYFRDENEASWRHQDWNARYRPHLDEIEKEYQLIRFEANQQKQQQQQYE